MKPADLNRKNTMTDLTTLRPGQRVTLKYSATLKPGKGGFKVSAPFATLEKTSEVAGNLAGSESYARKQGEGYTPSDRPSPFVRVEGKPAHILAHKDTGELYVRLVNPTFKPSTYRADGVAKEKADVAPYLYAKRGGPSEYALVKLANLTNVVVS